MAVVLSLASDGGIHSAALALNGAIVAYASEESTHNREYPTSLVHFCLDRAGVTETDIDQIVCSDCPLDGIKYRWQSLATQADSRSIFAAAQNVTSALFEASSKEIAHRIAINSRGHYVETYDPAELILNEARSTLNINHFVLYRLQHDQISATFWSYANNKWQLLADSSSGMTPLQGLYQHFGYTPSSSEETIQLSRIQSTNGSGCKPNRLPASSSQPVSLKAKQYADMNGGELFSLCQESFEVDAQNLSNMVHNQTVGIIFEGANLSAVSDNIPTPYFQATTDAKALLSQALSSAPEDKTAIWNEDSIETWLNHDNIRYRYCEPEQLAAQIDRALSNNLVVAIVDYENAEGSAFVGHLSSARGAHQSDIDELKHRRELTPTSLLEIALSNGAELLVCGRFIIELSDAKNYWIH